MAEPTRPTVYLISAGYRFTESDEVWSGTKVFYDTAARPGVTDTVTLPNIGDKWDETYDLMFCVNIDKTPIGDDTSAGFQYICTYSSYRTDSDVLKSGDGFARKEISVTVSTDASFDSYTYGADGAQKLYVTDDGSVFGELTESATVNRMTPNTNIVITERYDGNIKDILTDNASLVGKLNASPMWGYARGMILFNGVTATPIKGLSKATGKTIIKWNRSYNYSIRHLKNIDEEAWQFVFVQGFYVRLANDDNVAGMNAMNPYEYASLPDPLPSTVEE